MTFFVCLLTISLMYLIIFEFSLCWKCQNLLTQKKCKTDYQTFQKATSKCNNLSSTLPIFYNEEDFKYLIKLMDKENK